MAGHVLLAGGDRGRAEECWRQVAEIAERTQGPAALLNLVQIAIVTATLDGDLEGAVDSLQRLGGRAEELGVGGAAQGNLYATRLCGYVLREGLADMVVGRAGERSANPALCLAHLGRQAEAREILDQSLQLRWAAEGNRIDRSTIWLETAVLLHDRELAAKILPRLSNAARLTAGQYWDHTCVARHLGAAAQLLGDHEGARRFTEQAIEVATRIRHRPEIALSRLQLAELLLEGSPEEQTSAAAHLDFAIEELRAMKMQPYLERALGHKGLLKA